jgi:hypothetical protein
MKACITKYEKGIGRKHPSEFIRMIMTIDNLRRLGLFAPVTGVKQ